MMSQASSSIDKRSADVALARECYTQALALEDVSAYVCLARVTDDTESSINFLVAAAENGVSDGWIYLCQYFIANHEHSILLNRWNEDKLSMLSELLETLDEASISVQVEEQQKKLQDYYEDRQRRNLVDTGDDDSTLWFSKLPAWVAAGDDENAGDAAKSVTSLLQEVTNRCCLSIPSHCWVCQPLSIQSQAFRVMHFTCPTIRSHINPACIVPCSSDPGDASASYPVIGTGGFGKVYSGVLLLRTLDHENVKPIPVALKQLKPCDSEDNSVASFCAPDKQDSQRLIEELQRMRLLQRSPFITTCFGHTRCCLSSENEGPTDYLVMELAHYGTLADLLHNCAPEELPYALKVKWCYEIASGIHAMHRFFIKHLDIKPHNVLLFAGLQVKLADFGLSAKKRVAVDDYGDNSNNDAANLMFQSYLLNNRNDCMSSSSVGGGQTYAKIGTPGYIDPAMSSVGSQLASDIFSFGITMMHICTHQRPPPLLSEKYIRSNIASIECEALVKLIVDCTNFALEMRPTANDCMNSLHTELQSTPLDDNVMSEVESLIKERCSL